MGPWDGEWGAGGWLGMTLMMVLVSVPILVLGFFLVRALIGPGNRSDRVGDPAEDEARRAYARGEIDRERFLEIMRDLQDYSRSSH